MEQHFEISRQLIEIASWRMVTELKRRTPERLRIIETHPGGGLYDCLSLIDDRQHHMAAFNRNGSLAIFERFDGKEPRFDGSSIWKKAAMAHDFKRLVDEISEGLGLQVPKKLPPSTPEVMVFRTIAAALSWAAFGTDSWECRNGILDTSGFGGGTADTNFSAFDGARSRVAVRERDDIQDNPSYRFWFILKNGEPVVCLETKGLAWNVAGQEFDVLSLYNKSKRVAPIVSTLLARHLP